MSSAPRLSIIAAALLALSTSSAATAQLSKNVIFHAQLDEHAQYSNVWGYTAPGGDEYALVGTGGGVAVVNVSDPKNPYQTGFIPGPTSTWREIKTYQNYAYVTNENAGGLDIINLADPENPVGLPNYTGFSTAHTLYIDVSTARCYIAGSDLATGGVRILSLANPVSPVEIGSWETVYFHEVYVQDGVLFGSAIQNDTLYLLDVTNPASISQLGSVGNYPNAFTHSAWATPDGNYVMTTDEVVGAACRMWDVSNPSNITEVDLYLPNAATIPHNVHIEGDLAFISHYTIGVRIVDVSNPLALTERGWFDTWPADDSGNFRGCWGVYPFFQTNSDLLVASDFTRGLFVLEYKGTLGTLEGEITEAGNPSVAIPHATVTVLDTGNFTTPDAAGHYSIDDVPGTVTVEVSAFGYVTQTTGATIAAESVTPLDIALVPVPGGSISGTVSQAATGDPISGATVQVVSTVLAESSDGAGGYDFSSIPSGTYVVRAYAYGFSAMEALVTIPDGSFFDIDFALNSARVTETFEGAAGGWTVSTTATTGAWELADPEPTFDTLGQVQTGDDHTPSPGVKCWVTGPLAGVNTSAFDVDLGSTILTSPIFDATGLTNPHVRFSRWYVTGVLFNPGTDDWIVEISNNGGSSWTLLETTSLPNPAWVSVDVPISSLVTPTNQVRFRFIAQDLGGANIVEAAVDDFTIYGTDTHLATASPIGEPAAAGFALAIGPVVPNPLTGSGDARLSFSLPSKGPVSVRLYDVAGGRVATLDPGVLPAGTHEVRWNGRSDAGQLVAAGVYFVRVEAEPGWRSRKLLVVR